MTMRLHQVNCVAARLQIRNVNIGREIWCVDIEHQTITVAKLIIGLIDQSQIEATPIADRLFERQQSFALWPWPDRNVSIIDAFKTVYGCNTLLESHLFILGTYEAGEHDASARQ